MNEGVVSKETVVLRRWGSSIQKFGFINGVDNVNWPPGKIPKGLKMLVPFFLNQAAFFHVFLRAILFFQSLFQFCFCCKSSILQVFSTFGYPKRR